MPGAPVLVWMVEEVLGTVVDGSVGKGVDEVVDTVVVDGKVTEYPAC